MIINFIISLLVFVLLDAFWFSVFMGDFARAELLGLLDIKNGLIDVKFIYACLAYFSMSIAASVFLAPLIKRFSLQKTLIYSALMGFILYGIFDFTNMALLKNYSLSFLILDITWGTLIYMIVGVILRYQSAVREKFLK